MKFVFLIAKSIPLIYLLMLWASETKTSNEIESSVKMSKPFFEVKLNHAFAIVNVYIIEYWIFSYRNTVYSLL